MQRCLAHRHHGIHAALLPAQRLRRIGDNPIGVRGTSKRIACLPLEPEVEVLAVMGRLGGQLDDRLLAVDGVGLQSIAAHHVMAEFRLLVFMARGAAVALHRLLDGALVLRAARPLVAGLTGEEKA